MLALARTRLLCSQTQSLSLLPSAFVASQSQHRRSGHVASILSFARPRSHMTLRKHLSDKTLCKRVIVKVGSAILTKKDYGLALGRLASLVEQVSELHRDGKEIVFVSSGAVAFGRQLLSALGEEHGVTDRASTRSSSATGQIGLMNLFQSLFAQYGITAAQLLVTQHDFGYRRTVNEMKESLVELLARRVIPIVNENDAVFTTVTADKGLHDVIDLADNDSLAANLAVQLNADLMILLSNIKGVYTKPPSKPGSRLLHSLNPSRPDGIECQGSSDVGRGGMDTKIGAAKWAWDNGVAVVIADGGQPNVLLDICEGKTVGTFLTDSPTRLPASDQAPLAREGSRKLQQLTGEERGEIINKLADSLLAEQETILAANAADLDAAKQANISDVLQARLALTPAKLETLAEGLRQIAEASKSVIGRTLKKTELAPGVVLKQITSPLGVLLVIFESRPDCLPQVAALAIASGNGLLLKGGKEAVHSNRVLHNLVRAAVALHAPPETVGLIETRGEIADLFAQEQPDIDLIIPRGSNALVKQIQEQAKGIPVMGHADGVCHVFLDKDASLEMAQKIIVDAKCGYPAACNAMETLLIHQDLVGTKMLEDLFQTLVSNKIQYYPGPRVAELFNTQKTNIVEDFHTEYGTLECAIEVVSDITEAIKHIHEFGSSHTETIITDNEETAKIFLDQVDSACVFHNVSTRFADGYRFGLGAEVGISTSRLHARGPVGIEGLLTTKWQLTGHGESAGEFDGVNNHFTHKPLSIENDNE
eukprot:m.54982 g.54982  ORF g.54982 m.54982 type:complete len:765 (-) comp18574_c0_seq2:7-2301(-)